MPHMTQRDDGTWERLDGCPFVLMITPEQDDVAYHLEWHAEKDGGTK